MREKAWVGENDNFLRGGIVTISDSKNLTATLLLGRDLMTLDDL
jgi:hypothetical protein